VKAILAAFMLAGMTASASSTHAADDATGDDVFGLTRVYQVHLTVAAEDYPKMDPPPAFTPGGFGSRPRVTGPHAGADNFGYEFEFVSADVEVDGQTFPNVGLRYKGSGSYLASQFRAKRSFKIDFDRNDEDQTFRGLAKLNLNSGALDPTRIREVLAYAVFRAAGVPAPRTAFAEVTLTVPGRYDAEYLGLYTVVEQVDEPFLAAHFEDGEGLLLKPEGIRGLPYLGEDAADYVASYNAKSKEGRGDWSRLVELTRLVNEAGESEFREHIAEYLDVESFVRFLAANAVMSNMDGFIGLGHNYYIYLSPQTGQFTFMPWDLDLAFGAFAMYGTPDQIADLSLDHPHLGENKLIDRLLAMPEVKAAYLEHVRLLAAETWTPERIGADLAALEALAEGPIAKEQDAARARSEGLRVGLGGPMFAYLPLAEFIEKRRASIAEQQAGTHEGHVPRMFGFGEGFGASRETDEADESELRDADDEALTE
jgi:spore coat protein H